MESVMNGTKHTMKWYVSYDGHEFRPWRGEDRGKKPVAKGVECACGWRAPSWGGQDKVLVPEMRAHKAEVGAPKRGAAPTALAPEKAVEPKPAPKPQPKPVKATKPVEKPAPKPEAKSEPKRWAVVGGEIVEPVKPVPSRLITRPTVPSREEWEQSDSWTPSFLAPEMRELLVTADRANRMRREAILAGERVA